ncbi:MAG: orotate phosphoribosyltransferase [Armatimonadetes bacterium Cent15-Ar3]|nr:MAG: orotate phosphoribosyltransferase [Armatimonadetes bacterium Cent15-Ar3]
MLKGHFVLTSGRHSDTYFEKFRVLEQPEVLVALCREIAKNFKGQGIEYVAGPTTGGIIIAFEVARQMGLQAVYIESENGEKTLRRGKTLPEGGKVLIVDDVLTTGRSLFESRDAIQNAGGTPTGYGVLINRAQGELALPSLFSAFTVEATSYGPEEVPDWLAAIPTSKPGTRK